jgi:alpha-L-arabinofuranosidase
MRARGSIFFISVGLAASAQTTIPRVTAVVDAAKAGVPISPYVYGQFIEHAGNISYSGLWSEMLEDRKFFYAVQPKPPEEPNAGQRGTGGFGRGRRRNAGPGHWNPIDPVDSVVMATNQPFVGEHTPLIKLAGAEPRGIRQTGLNFIQGTTYRGRIQLTGDATASVTIDIVWGDGVGAVRRPVSIGGLSWDYQAIPFSFKAAQSGSAQFEIVGTGTSSFHIGAVSLMPADNLGGFRPDSN